MVSSTPSAEDLRKLGVDLGILDSLPRGRQGEPWAPAWRAACEVLFVNGFSPAQISRALNGPSKDTIYEWSEAGGWFGKRDQLTRELTERATAQTVDNSVEVIKRHLTELQVAQKAAIQAILQQKVQGKTLEGVISSLVMAIRAERQVLGLSDPEPEAANSQVNIYMQQLNVPAERRAEVFAALSSKFEIEERLHALTAGDSSSGGVNGPPDSPQITIEGGASPQSPE